MDPVILRLAVSLGCYLSIFICGFIITITMGLTKSNFDGNCPLYSEIRWTHPRYISAKFASFGAGSTCNYVIYVPLLFSIVYPFILLMYYGYITYQTHRGNKDVLGKLKTIPLLVATSVSFLFILIAAGIVTTGRRFMCYYIRDRPENIHATYISEQDSCYYAENIRHWGTDKFRTSSFMRNIITGEATLWFSLLFWVVLIGLLVERFWKERQQGQNPQEKKTEEKKTEEKKTEDTESKPQV